MRTWHIVTLATILIALIGGGYYYNQKIATLQSNITELRTDQLNKTQTQQSITTPITQAEQTTQVTTATPSPTPQPAPKKTYIGDVFSFQYPNDWIVEQNNAMGQRQAIFKKNGIEIAKLDCPIPVFGFENIKTTSVSKEISKGSGTTALSAEIKFIYGSAWDPKEKDELLLISMSKNNKNPDEQQGQYGTDCLLLAQKLTLLETFKDIYKNITLN